MYIHTIGDDQLWVGYWASLAEGRGVLPSILRLKLLPFPDAVTDSETSGHVREYWYVKIVIYDNRYQSNLRMIKMKEQKYGDRTCELIQRYALIVPSCQKAKSTSLCFQRRRSQAHHLVSLTQLHHSESHSSPETR